jgi:hypothetical protein
MEYPKIPSSTFEPNKHQVLSNILWKFNLKIFLFIFIRLKKIEIFETRKHWTVQIKKVK